MSRPQRRVCHLKIPEKIHAPVYAGCNQSPPTPRSATPVAWPMHPKHGRAGALPTPEAWARCPGTARAGLLVVAGGAAARSGPRPTQGTPAVGATHAHAWTTVRMMRAGQEDAEAGGWARATATRRGLPLPSAGLLSLIGERTWPGQCGRHHPWGPTT